MSWMSPNPSPARGEFLQSICDRAELVESAEYDATHAIEIILELYGLIGL